MNKIEITTRKDIYLLVSTFYDKIKEDDFIGHIFLKKIPLDEWENHLQKLTDFWESNLFFTRKFRGNPITAHNNVDEDFNYEISQQHFGRWLQLWFTTIDELFVGEKAHEAKERARNIASMLFFKMYDNKPK